jgi:hypothetical protein
MTVTLSSEVEQKLRERAASLGKQPDQLANEVLMRELLQQNPEVPEIPPRDEWEARLMKIGEPSTFVPTDEQLSRESIYED